MVNLRYLTDFLLMIRDGLTEVDSTLHLYNATIAVAFECSTGVH